MYRYDGDRNELIKSVHDALYCSKICAYAQGFQLMRAAEAEYGWKLDFASIASIWRGGCIIRARFLQKITDAYDGNSRLVNLLLDPYFKEQIQNNQTRWRSVVAIAAQAGVAAPAFMSALAYYDGYRSAKLPANLLQAQRDYFGAHTYERIDQPRGVISTLNGPNRTVRRSKLLIKLLANTPTHRHDSRSMRSRYEQVANSRPQPALVTFLPLIAIDFRSLALAASGEAKVIAPGCRLGRAVLTNLRRRSVS